MSTLLDAQGAAAVAAQLLFGAACVVGLYQAGKLTLARIRR